MVSFEKYNLESSITSTAQIDFRPLYVARIRKEGNVIFILCERFVQETTLFRALIQNDNQNHPCERVVCSAAESLCY